MIIAAILLGISQVITTFGACLLLRKFLNAKQAEIEARAERALRDWVESPKEGQPSKLAVMVDAMGAVVGSSAARSLRASLQQEASSVAQVANGAADQLQAQANPLLGILAGGKRGKGAALMRLAEMLGPAFLGNKHNGDGGGVSAPPRNMSL